MKRIDELCKLRDMIDSAKSDIEDAQRYAAKLASAAADNLDAIADELNEASEQVNDAVAEIEDAQEHPDAKAEAGNG